MIDDKKIEAAANKHIKAEYARYNSGKVDDEMICLMGKDSFKEGAKCAINEFIKDLWYSNTEKPKEDSNIVYIDENDEFWDIDNYNSDNFDDSFGKGWDSACRTQNIYKWCYKEDLLQKEGGQQ